MERNSSREHWWKAKSSSYESWLQRTSSVVFLTAESLPCSETQPSKGSYGQRNYVLKWKYVIRNVPFTFDFKKFLENALRFVTDVVLNILPCAAYFTRVDGATILEV